MADDIVLRVTLQDLADPEITKLVQHIVALRDEIGKLGAEQAKLESRFGTFAGGIRFDKLFPNAPQVIRDLGNVERKLEELYRLKDIGIKVTVDPSGAIQASTAARTIQQPARQTAFARPEGDLDTLAIIDNTRRLTKAQADQQAELKHQFDQETAINQKRARDYEEMINRMVAAGNRFRTEQEKLHREQARFQQQVAPSENVAAYRRLQQETETNEINMLQRQRQRTDALIADMARRKTARDADIQSANLSTVDMAGKFAGADPDFASKISIGKDKLTGSLKVIRGDLKETAETAEKAGIKFEGALRHMVAIFDEAQRGQRGAMTASVSAMIRDMGLLDVIVNVLKSSWGGLAIAAVAAGAAIIYTLEQQYQRMAAIRDLQGSLALRGAEVSPQSRANIAQEFDAAKKAGNEFAGTEREYTKEAAKFPIIAQSIVRELENITKGFAAINRADPLKMWEQTADAASHGAAALNKLEGERLGYTNVLQENGRTVAQNIEMETNEAKQFEILMEAVRKYGGALAQIGLESHKISAIDLGLKAMAEDQGIPTDLANEMKKMVDPLGAAMEAGKGLVQTLRALSGEEQAVANAVIQGTDALVKQVKILREYEDVKRAADTLRQFGDQGELPVNPAYKRAVEAGEAAAKAGLIEQSDTADQALRRRLRLAEIEKEAKERPEDPQAQIKAAQERLELERQIEREKLTPEGVKPPDNLNELVEANSRVATARQAVADAQSTAHRKETESFIEGEKAKIAEIHRGGAERLAAQDEIIAKLRKEVDAGQESQQKLDQAVRERATLQRSVLDEEFAAFRDHSRAQLEDVKENAEQIKQIYRQMWQEALRTGQTTQVFEEIGREQERSLNAARQRTFETFSAGERDKIEEARGDWAKIMAIYQEWADFAAKLFGETSRQFSEVHREMVKSAHQGIDEINREEMRYADAQVKVMDSVVRMNQLQREAQDLTFNKTQSHHAAVVQNLQTQLAEVQKTAAAEMAIYERIYNLEGAKTDEKLAAIEKEAEIAQRAATEEMEIAKKISEEQKKAAEEAKKVWTDFFKKIGDDFGKLIGDVFDRKPGALYDFLQSARKSIFGLGEGLLGQMLGKAFGVDVKSGEGFGGLFTGLLSKFLGIDQKDPSKEAAAAAKAAQAQRDTANKLLARIHDLIAAEQKKLGPAREELKKKEDEPTTTPTTGGGGGTTSGPLTPVGERGTGMGGTQGFFSDEMKNMFAAAAKDGIHLGVGSGFRDSARQAQLFKEAVEKYGSEAEARKHVAPPGHSMHERGLAADLTEDGHLIRKGSPADEWIAQHGKDYGIVRPMSYEPWHVQPQSTTPMSVPQRRADDDGKPKPVNITHIGSAGVTTPEQSGALPTSRAASAPSGPAQVQIIQSIPLDVKVMSMPPQAAAPQAQGHAFGGPIGPGGTDTIPAWLSPGEFVMQKSAVDFYGRDKMHRMNSMRAHFGGLAFQGGGSPYDQISSESRGFQSVAMVPVQKGLGKWGWLLAAAAGIGGLALLGSLFSDDDKRKTKDDQALADKLLKSPDFGTSDSAAFDESAGDYGGGADFAKALSPLATTSTGKPTTADSSGSESKGILSSLSGLTSGFTKLIGDVTGLGSAVSGTSGQTSAFGQELNVVKSATSAVSSVFSSLKSITGLFGGGGGAGGLGGIGSIFTGLFGLFGLAQGGIIPSAAGGMIMPRFQRGGILSMVHANEMVLPSHISQMVQNAANNNSGGAGPSGHTVNFHINTIDQRTGAQFLMSNADGIAKAYARSYRNYSTNVPRS